MHAQLAFDFDVAPASVWFRDGLTCSSLVAALGLGRFHTWAVSDEFQEMAGGFGRTPDAARNNALHGLLLNIDEQTGDKPK